MKLNKIYKKITSNTNFWDSLIFFIMISLLTYPFEKWEFGLSEYNWADNLVLIFGAYFTTGGVESWNKKSIFSIFLLFSIISLFNNASWEFVILFCYWSITNIIFWNVVLFPFRNFGKTIENNIIEAYMDIKFNTNYSEKRQNKKGSNFLWAFFFGLFSFLLSLFILAIITSIKLGAKY